MLRKPYAFVTSKQTVVVITTPHTSTFFSRNRVRSLLVNLVAIVLVSWIMKTQHLNAQQSTVNRKDYMVKMQRIDYEVKIDGKIEEQCWINGQRASDFHRVTPIDEGMAAAQSEVILAYDEANLYIAIICHDTLAGKRPVESLRRDFSFGSNDNFLVFIDTYNDQTNGFSFGISAAGAEWDGIQADGGFVSLNWDTKWSSAVQNYPDRWTAEFAVPFKSIRYKDGATEWGINFSRFDLKSGEKSSWAPVPRQFQTANLAFTGTLKWDDPLPGRGIRYSVIPYIFGKTTKNNLVGEKAKLEGEAGVDAKLTLSTSLNLDLTLNPDFSQVEVDEQRTNLDRFELFFPERRQFFLENSDLFASLGEDNNRPFFSRRIGLENPVHAGLRLSGKLDQKTRIGLMNVQTGTEMDALASNFSVGVLQRQVLGRSNISAFVINRSVTSDRESTTALSNQVAGLEFNLATADNQWTGKLFYHHAFSDIEGGTGMTASAQLTHQTQRTRLGMKAAFIDSDYHAEVGFIRRVGVIQLALDGAYRFFPDDKAITSHGPDLEIDFFMDQSGTMRDRETEVSYNATWRDRSTISAQLTDDFIRLRSPFDPTNSGGAKLPADSEYRWNRWSLRYQSNPRSLFNYTLRIAAGGFYNGDRLALRSELSYRIQPIGRLGVVTTYDKIELPTPYNSRDFWLFGPKLDITFTNKIFFTTFIQYNKQIDNVNINTRFQWRFAPGSDFFLVYTHNAFPEGLRNKDRGLVAKMSYWFN